MESVPFRKIRQIAEDYDAKLLATDPRFRREVTLVHTDGSIMHYNSAFLMRIQGTWIAVFTEHHRLMVYDADDLMLYWESERRHEPIEELNP
jgi:hypothetical protein